MSYVVCETADDPECLGGADETDSVGCRSLHDTEMARLKSASFSLALLLHVHWVVRGCLQVQRDCPGSERFIHELIVCLSRCFNSEGAQADHYAWTASTLRPPSFLRTRPPPLLLQHQPPQTRTLHPQQAHPPASLLWALLPRPALAGRAGRRRSLSALHTHSVPSLRSSPARSSCRGVGSVVISAHRSAFCPFLSGISATVPSYVP